MTAKKKHSSAGRKTKLTPDVQEKIVRAIRAGNYKQVAARYAGIDEATLYRWIEKGENGQAPFREFCKAVKDAEAAAEVSDIALIKQASHTTWQAAAWLRERMTPERWGRYDRSKIEADVKVETKDPHGELDRFIAGLAARLRTPSDDPDAES